MQAMNNKWLGFASPKDHPLQNQFAEPNHHVLTFLTPIFYCKGHIVTMGRAGLVRTRNSISGYLKPILLSKVLCTSHFRATRGDALTMLRQVGTQNL